MVNSLDCILCSTDYILCNRFLCVEACRNHVEYFDRDGKIAVTDLKWMVWTMFAWLRIYYNGRLLWTRQWTLGDLKRREFVYMSQDSGPGSPQSFNFENCCVDTGLPPKSPVILSWTGLYIIAYHSVCLCASKEREIFLKTQFNMITRSLI
jgi:hypothetical protein